jgi:hypothetical protein
MYEVLANVMLASCLLSILLRRRGRPHIRSLRVLAKTSLLAAATCTMAMSLKETLESAVSIAGVSLLIYNPFVYGYCDIGTKQ